jgi:hypothetical protein
MNQSIAKTKNLTMLLELYQSLDGARSHVEKMGLVLGEPGIGKTTAATFLQNQTNCLLITCLPIWTNRSMLQAIALELGESGTGSAAAIFDRCASKLRITRRGIVFDETDERLFQNEKRHIAMVDTIRALYDQAKTPFVFIGYNQTRSIINGFPQLDGRISQQANFQRLDDADTRRFLDLFAQFTPKACLFSALMQATEGRPRQTVTAIENLNNKAAELGLSELSVEDWGNAPLFPGDRRR